MIEFNADYLRARGFRLTPQRLAILGILREAHNHLTPVEVYQHARKIMPGITEATVYRTLNFLSGQGLILAAHVGNGQIVYEFSEHAHHHLICRACGETCEINHEALQALYEQLQAKTGFQIDTIHLTFFGLCPGCQQA